MTESTLSIVEKHEARHHPKSHNQPQIQQRNRQSCHGNSSSHHSSSHIQNKKSHSNSNEETDIDIIMNAALTHKSSQDNNVNSNHIVHYVHQCV